MALVLGDVRSCGQSGNYLLFPSISHFDPKRKLETTRDGPAPVLAAQKSMLSKVLILERGHHANCLRRTRPVEIARGKPKFKHDPTGGFAADTCRAEADIRK